MNIWRRSGDTEDVAASIVSEVMRSLVYEFQHLLSQAEVTMLLKVKEEYQGGE